MSQTERDIDSLYTLLPHSSVYCDDSNQTPLTKLSHAGWQNKKVIRPHGLQSIGASQFSLSCNECTNCIDRSQRCYSHDTTMKAMSLLYLYSNLKNSTDERENWEKVSYQACQRMRHNIPFHKEYCLSPLSKMLHHSSNHQWAPH